VIATTIPIKTKITIATCIQIQVGDMRRGYSAWRKSAVTVSSTIFRSKPSDQWAM
jgi:hypothetical protein